MHALAAEPVSGIDDYPDWVAMLPPQVKPEPAVQEKQWSPTGIRTPGEGS